MRLLAMLVAVVLVAVGTVALLTRQATQDQFFQYVTQSRSELSSAVSELGEQGAPRIVFLGPQNKVLADSAVRQAIDKKAAAAEAAGVWVEKPAAPVEAGGRVEKPVVLA